MNPGSHYYYYHYIKHFLRARFQRKMHAWFIANSKYLKLKKQQKDDLQFIAN